MQKSESIEALAEAMSNFQGEIKDVCKDEQGYGFAYAKLDQVLEVARPLLAKNGLSVIQMPTEGTEVVVVLETILMHKSGQWISSRMEMAAERLVSKKGNKMSLPQSIGSVITYARRYSLASLLGIAQVDNDAAKEEENDRPKVQGKIVPISSEASSTARVNLISIESKAKLDNLIRILAISKEDLNKWLVHYGIDSFDKLTDKAAERLINKLQDKVIEMDKEDLKKHRKDWTGGIMPTQQA